MQVNQEMLILGAKRSQGTLDNGNHYDSTKIYVQTPMKHTADQAGFSSVEYTWGDSNNFYKLRDFPFPLKANVTLEIVTNGKTSQTIIVDVLPLPQIKDSK